MTEHYKHAIKYASQLKPYANNSRTHSKKQIAEVARSIEQFGFTNPLLVDEKNEEIAGHCRLQAAETMGRNAIVSELDPKFAHVIVERYTAFTGVDEIIVNGEPRSWSEMR